MDDEWLLVRELEQDIFEIGALVKANQASLPLRRTYVRTVFSALEGVLYDLRQNIIQYSNIDSLFTIKERGKLFEKRVEDGVVTKIDKYLPLVESIPFTSKCFAKHMGINNFEFPYASEGWIKMHSSIKVRHRITHLKSAADFNVSIQEIDDLVKAKMWFKGDVSQKLIPDRNLLTSSSWETHIFLKVARRSF